MTRPISHRSQEHPRRCGNCRHCHMPTFQVHWMCFCGDNYVARRSPVYSWQSDVVLDGEDVSLLQGDEFDKVWGGRVVDPDDICDEWEGVDSE